MGLRSRPDLNGRRVEVRGQAPGQDGAPSFVVRLLFGDGAGSVMKVNAASLELNKDCALDPAMASLVTAMQAREERRDWAGLPIDVLAKIAETLVAQTEAGRAAQLKEWGNSEGFIQQVMAKRKRDGNCPLFVFARVCRGWRKAQLKVGGPLRTRVRSDVIMAGRAELAKWALAEGCPRAGSYGSNMAHTAAQYGHLELVKWLCGEGGFAMTRFVMESAAFSGNLELVKWLQGEGCPWNRWTCRSAVEQGHVEVLRWARENGCPWTAHTRDLAAAELGYTDDFGNLDEEEEKEEEEYGYEDSDEEYSDDE